MHRQKTYTPKQKANKYVFKANRHGALPIIGLALIRRNLVLKMLALSALLLSYFSLTVDLSLHKVEGEWVPDGVWS